MTLLLAAALLVAAPGGASPNVAAALERPRDPWVFRCVLDGRARSVVVALDADLWVAYDATSVALTEAWKGDVQLQGAVYDTVHGPQPVSRGPSYATGLEGPVWFAEVEGELLELEPRWRGYAFVPAGIEAGFEARVELRFEALLPSGERVRVFETPEVRRSERFHERQLGIPAGLTGLARTWRVEVPEGVLLFLRDRRASRHLFAQNVRGMRADPDRGGVLVELDPVQETALTYFFDPPPEEPAATPAAEVRDR